MNANIFALIAQFHRGCYRVFDLFDYVVDDARARYWTFYSNLC